MAIAWDGSPTKMWPLAKTEGTSVRHSQEEEMMTTAIEAKLVNERNPSSNVELKEDNNEAAAPPLELM